MNYFFIKDRGSMVEIRNRSRFPFHSYTFFIDNQQVATFFQGNTFYLSKIGLPPGQHLLSIVAHYQADGMQVPLAEQHFIVVPQLSSLLSQGDERVYARDFRAGDILVASNNVDEKMTGYMGHSAIVVSPDQLIECPGGHPAMEQDTIQQFLEYHPHHAHYRPRLAEMGQRAAAFALNYLSQYRRNLKNGIEQPIFSFSLNVPLEDPWTAIYCSKLIWLSYFYGANYKFINDFLWFSPEDLHHNLKDNEHFELLYQHPEFGFLINT
ncbi:hypothetical protein [Ammoniphilus resinae]|uniref:Uncharacterized protein n=1 Tax=Ammoniphilus resinae TaxID=861532 RepID=A0ABS4GYG3_9BACL|nr:hypothetical protein [Ammoniphilus resinae]MBP1935077.1 hypothetical protein [Ammoniphilus resinae]